MKNYPILIIIGLFLFACGEVPKSSSSSSSTNTNTETSVESTEKDTDTDVQVSTENDTGTDVQVSEEEIADLKQIQLEQYIEKAEEFKTDWVEDFDYIKTLPRFTLPPEVRRMEEKAKEFLEENEDVSTDQVISFAIKYMTNTHINFLKYGRSSDENEIAINAVYIAIQSLREDPTTAKAKVQEMISEYATQALKKLDDFLDKLEGNLKDESIPSDPSSN